MIAHIASNGVRASLIVNEGLLSLGLEVKCNRDEFLLGKLLVRASNNFIDDLFSSDLIFVGDDDKKSYRKYDKAIDQLWHKIVWYDYKDSTSLDTEILSRCRCYFKRSLSVKLPRVHPIDFCALAPYFRRKKERTVDVACMFNDQLLPANQLRRRNLLEVIRRNDHRFSVCYGNNAGTVVRQGISFGDGDLLDYWDSLASSKIVFTAYPQNWDGDSRTWEAFASGALVFKDISCIYSPNPPVPGLHYIEFDASDKSSIQDAVEKAAYYLQNEKEMKVIASAGKQHIIDYHRPQNRVSRMLKLANLKML